MVFRCLNVSTHEIPITVTVYDDLSRKKYPGIIVHKWASIDFAEWGLMNVSTLFALFLTLVFSDNFLREYLADNLVPTSIIP
jgi:hypothetical protein